MALSRYRRALRETRGEEGEALAVNQMPSKKQDGKGRIDSAATLERERVRVEAPERG